MSIKGPSQGQLFFDSLVRHFNYSELSEDLAATGTDLAGATEASGDTWITQGITATSKGGISLPSGNWVGQRKRVSLLTLGNSVNLTLYYNDRAGIKRKNIESCC